MKIIDSHIHIGKWSGIFYNYESSVTEAIDVMKRSGVDAAVCMPTDITGNDELFKQTIDNNDFRFYYNAWINPDDVSLDEFLEKNLGRVSLFKIHPSIQRKKITDASYDKYIQIASENKIPVVVHCGRWQEIASFKFPLELTEKYPDLILILAHLGGDQPSIYLECAETIRDKKYKNVYLGTESVREFYFVNKVVNTVGAEKVIFGSDYNLGLPLTYIPIVDSLRIPASDKELIFSGNIMRLIEDRGIRIFRI
ncbi:MAG: amidohydrolase family protein [Ignavibacteria bacterium]|nr:amidohydrolase family protein [Ignavibacteria bacterium]MBK9403477.1 amidohydrolase family protein [Ignavibacteria bacterium]